MQVFATSRRRCRPYLLTAQQKPPQIADGEVRSFQTPFVGASLYLHRSTQQMATIASWSIPLRTSSSAVFVVLLPSSSRARVLRFASRFR